MDPPHHDRDEPDGDQAQHHSTGVPSRDRLQRTYLVGSFRPAQRHLCETAASFGLGDRGTPHTAPSGGMMFAIIAAVLFLIALIFQLAGMGFGTVNATVLVTAGLLCLALDLIGLGRRFRL